MIKKQAEHKVLRNYKNEIRHEMTEIKTVDYEWLIEQVERVQGLENENWALRTVAESNKYIGEQYLEQNKRYREAIFKALDALPVGFKNEAVRILGEALESESNE